MKHPRRNCMRNREGGAEACCGTRGWRKGQAPRKVARNSIEQSFNKVRKRCNSNDLNSMFEIVAGELRAKFGMASAMPQARAEHDTRAVGPGCGARGRWRGLAGLRGDAPSEARSADGSRAGRRPPAHTAAGPDGAQNTSGAASNKLNREFRLCRRRGRLAGGPPPTGTPSSPAHSRIRRRPEHQRRHKHHRTEKPQNSS